MTYVAPTTTVYTNGVPSSTYQGGKSTPITPPAPSPTVASQQVNGQNFVPRGADGSANYATGATPVAVVSSNAAATKVNGPITSAMNNGQAAIVAQNAKVAGVPATDPNYQVQPGETLSQYNARIAKYNTTKSTTATPDTTNPTSDAASAIANTPDAGNQFAYDTNGNRVEIGIGAPIPSGYSTSQPANPALKGHTVVDSAQNSSTGGTYNQYSDGTYGLTDASGNFVQAVSSSDFDNAKNNDPATISQQIVSALASLKMGAIPLTPAQEAQINGLQSQLQSDIATQTQANANYTGGVTVAENLYGMGNSIAGLGTIKGTIDAGVAAIAKLQTDSAVAIAKMTDAFDQENYTDLSNYYKDLQSANAGIQSHIDSLQAAAVKAKEDAQTEAHQNFQDAISSETLTLNQKKQVFDQYMQQATLDEKTKADAADAWYKQQDIALRVQAQNPGGPNGTGPTPVALGSNGAPNKASQAAFLANYPTNVQTQIKGLADYSLLPTSFPTRAAKGEMDRATAVALAKQYDPTYDENLAAARQKAKITYSDGTSAPAKSITALNTAAGHLATLADSFSKLHNVGFGPANTVINTLGSVTGLKSTSGAATTIAAVTGELAAAFKSSGATDTEIKSLGTIDVNSSPKQVQDYVAAATGLMGSKIAALNDSYTSAVGAPPDSSFLHTSAATDLIKLQTEGYNIDVPALATTPPVELKNFVAASPANSAVYDSAKAAIMGVNGGAAPSADDIYQLLQQQGYVQ